MHGSAPGKLGLWTFASLEKRVDTGGTDVDSES